MDPKMDSGIVSKYCSLDEAIEDGAAPVPLSHDKTIDVQSIIDIMDHLLACEVMSGLSSTIFNPMRFQNRCRRLLNASELC